MRSSFFYSYFFFVFILFVFISFSICTYLVADPNTTFDSSTQLFATSSVFITHNFLWPTPKYTKITSPFGYRVSPTTGKKSFHGGIDIGAPKGSEVLACYSGKVKYTGFYSANGFTVIISSDNYDFFYSHLSPNFIVSEGDYVVQGQIIGYIGPKNVYGVPNNPYKDSNGNPTNGSTTGPHLHFAIRKDGKAVNPLNYF